MFTFSSLSVPRLPIVEHCLAFQFNVDTEVLRNAVASMVVTDLPMVSVSRAEQEEKADRSMVVTDSGMVTLVSLEHL